jgi:hypothetical protein
MQWGWLHARIINISALNMQWSHHIINRGLEEIVVILNHFLCVYVHRVTLFSVSNSSCCDIEVGVFEVVLLSVLHLWVGVVNLSRILVYSRRYGGVCVRWQCSRGLGRCIQDQSMRHEVWEGRDIAGHQCITPGGISSPFLVFWSIHLMTCPHPPYDHTHQEYG